MAVPPLELGTAHKTSKPIIFLLLALGLVALLAGALGVFAVVRLATPLAQKSVDGIEAWSRRLEADYPYWEVIGSRTWTSAGKGSKTSYSFTVVPIGEDFPIVVTYVAEKGAEPRLEDEVFRADGRFRERADSLLDYLRSNYAQHGKVIADFRSYPDGTAVVTWKRASSFLVFSSTQGSSDELIFYEGERGTWAKVSATTGAKDRDTAEVDREFESRFATEYPNFEIVRRAPEGFIIEHKRFKFLKARVGLFPEGTKPNWNDQPLEPFSEGWVTDDTFFRHDEGASRNPTTKLSSDVDGFAEEYEHVAARSPGAVLIGVWLSEAFPEYDFYEVSAYLPGSANSISPTHYAVFTRDLGIGWEGQQFTPYAEQ